MKVSKQKCHGISGKVRPSRLVSQSLRSRVPRVNAADFDWKQASGTTLNVAFNQHPYADAIIQRLPQFKELTGIDVKHELTPGIKLFRQGDHPALSGPPASRMFS